MTDERDDTLAAIEQIDVGMADMPRQMDPLVEFFALFGEWSAMIEAYCKPGQAILDSLDAKRYGEWIAMLAQCSDSGQRLDMLKKSVVYNKAGAAEDYDRFVRGPAAHIREHRVEMLTYEQMRARLHSMTAEDIHILHMSTGIIGEAAELNDTLCMGTFGGEKLRREDLIEEVGDLLWYVQGLLAPLGITFEEVFQANLTKLQLRYSLKRYSDEQAQARADKVGKDDPGHTAPQG